MFSLDEVEHVVLNNPIFRKRFVLPHQNYIKKDRKH